MPDNNKNKPNQSKIRTIDKITPEMNQFMDIIRLKESNDKSGIRNPKGSAYGYYQVIGSTLDNYNNKYGTKYTLNTREEQHEFMRLMMLESQQFFRKNNIPETLENYYKKHVIGDNTKFLKFIKAEQSGGNLNKFLTQKEINDNPGLFKDSKGNVLNVSEANKKVSDFINSGKKALAKEPSDRKKQVQLEKTGIYEGRSTPLDKRAGNYINDGKAEWDPNSKYYNGRRLGEQNNDFVVSVGDNKNKVIMQGSSQESEVDKGFTPKGYDYDSAPLYDDNTWYNSPSSSATQEPFGYGDPSIKNFSTGKPNIDLSYEQIRNPRVQPIQDRQLSKADILNATARYSNEKNPYTDAGNIEHLITYDNKGNPVAMNNPTNLSVNTDTYLNATQGLSNPDMPASDAQRQFAKGGNLNEQTMKQKKLNKALEEGNDGLISFNEGGTHNENPYGGIPQNNNEDGSLNTVEEGETKQGDYVFSNKLTITPQLAEELRLPKQVENKTFAEASKILNDVLTENPRDPIIKRTVDKQLDSLKLGNEKAKEENQANEQSQRQAQFEIDNVDLLNELDKQSENADQDINAQPNIQSDNVPQNPNVGFSEEDLNMFANGGELDSTWLDRNGNGISSGIQGGINLASTLAFAEDPYQEEKIKPGQTALKGAGTGATLGASVGSVIPGLGTAIGAAAGAVIGGVSGLIVGNSKAKKQEKIINKRNQDRENRALAPFRDPRNDSGWAEEREVFADGGPLKNGTGITYTNFDESDLNNLFDLNLNYNTNIPANNVPVNNIITTNSGPVPVNNYWGPYENGAYYTDLGTPNVPNTATSTNSAPSNSSENFRGRGENLLQYASLLGSYQDMRNANAKQPEMESYRATGTRMQPYQIDVNNIMNELRYSANTADSLIQRNSNGNSAVARANILANRMNVNRATGEALIKAEEYNNNQNQMALQYNNQLEQYFDRSFNEEVIANAQNRSALEAERFRRRTEFLTNLSNFGREQSNRNAAYNLSGGYDRYGNKNEDMLQSLIDAIRKNQNNQNT